MMLMAEGSKGNSEYVEVGCLVEVYAQQAQAQPAPRRFDNGLDDMFLLLTRHIFSTRPVPF